MQYCKYLKLVNGENLIVMTDNNCEMFKQQKTIKVCNIVEVKSIRLTEGPLVLETFVLQPWIKMATKDNIHIPTESIIVAVDLQESAIEQYKEFVTTSEQQPTGDNEPHFDEPDMEDILSEFESEEGNDEKERDEYNARSRFGRTIH